MEKWASNFRAALFLFDITIKKIMTSHAQAYSYVDFAFIWSTINKWENGLVHSESFHLRYMYITRNYIFFLFEPLSPPNPRKGGLQEKMFPTKCCYFCWHNEGNMWERCEKVPRVVTKFGWSRQSRPVGLAMWVSSLVIVGSFYQRRWRLRHGHFR